MVDKVAKILIVDDNPDFLFTMETFLNRNGFETIVAEDGKKGVELAKREHPDLVLLDVMMETLFSGFEVCKQLKLDPGLKDVPIIGISGMGDELGVGYKKERDEEYFNPDEFFEKPVDKGKLLAKIKELLGQ
ncbi:MAG: response regulator [Deltaproteobacteria bacterium]|jgi:DNA-binding response OmpR family regulator